jgi:hypothetical protein
MRVTIIVLFSLFLTIIVSCDNYDSIKINNHSSVVCDEKGNKYISAEKARKSGLSDAEFGATYCASYKKKTGNTGIHYTWDMNEDGINDCEDDAICDHTIDYTTPRYEILGVKDDIVFDKRSGK